MRTSDFNAFPAVVCTVFAALMVACTAGADDVSLSVSAETEHTFHRFIGTWTLKDDQFQQVWDGETVETLTIPNHITECEPLNTDRSILCQVDAGDFQGHIIWSFDADEGVLHHLSHFGTSRLGTGQGEMDSGGNLRNRIRFTDEPAGTYRVYTYTWVTADEYEMMSRQYNADGSATGNWYGGVFVRLVAD